MTLSPGTHLGPYDVVAAIGAGGMGEVYRARDTKLNRDVALKILPDTFAADPERLARFKREAQVLASLNHPHIAAIYGMEELDGRAQALVMEFVDGEDLAQRVTRGRLALDEALPIARQIADALETAHEQGIIHRDLKPANVKVKANGAVKVLDFGLAKAMEPASGLRAHVTSSPTITTPAMTGRGVILGTAAYMSPEQAKGRPADRRSDIWAFGCVLFELLSGARPFPGDDLSETLASVIKSEPDWHALPADVPVGVRTILRRCLQKDPQKRLPHIGLVRIELDEGSTAPAESGVVAPAATSPLWQRALPAAAAAIVAGLIVGATMWTLRPATSPMPVSRSVFMLPDVEFIDPALRSLAISPDGTRIAYAAKGALHVRAMSELESRIVPGSQATQGFLGEPVFSPDGQSLAYWSGGSGATATLKRIAITGGTPVTICQGSFPLGTTWDAGSLVFGQSANAAENPTGARLMKVSADGGKPSALVNLERSEGASSPQVLPGGEAVLFTLLPVSGRPYFSQEEWDNAQVVVQSIKSGDRKVLVKGGSDGRFLPTGHLVYAVGSTLFAVPFDLKSLTPRGSPTPVVEGVLRTQVAGTSVLGGAHLSVSNTGTLVYLPSSLVSQSANMTLALIERVTGTMTKLSVPPGRYVFPRVSPDGKRVAVTIESGTGSDIWIYELAGTTAIRQLTFGGTSGGAPVWSGDSARVAFVSNREGDVGIFSQAADGSGSVERLTKPEHGAIHVPHAWSPDGNTLLFSAIEGTTKSLRVLSTRDRKTTAFGVTTNPAFAVAAAFSPDGRWVAYTSTSSPTRGDVQTFVQPFPPTGAKYSAGPSFHPLWSSDGRGLFVQGIPPAPNGLLSVNTQTGFAFGNPQPAAGGFRERGPFVEREHDMTRDGRYFVGVVDAAADSSSARVAPQIRIVLNWFEELKQKVPVK